MRYRGEEGWLVDFAAEGKEKVEEEERTVDMVEDWGEGCRSTTRNEHQVIRLHLEVIPVHKSENQNNHNHSH